LAKTGAPLKLLRKSTNEVDKGKSYLRLANSKE